MGLYCSCEGRVEEVLQSRVTQQIRAPHPDAVDEKEENGRGHDLLELGRAPAVDLEADPEVEAEAEERGGQDGGYPQTPEQQPAARARVVVERTTSTALQ